MALKNIFSATDVFLDLEARSKRSLLQTLAAEAASRLRRPEQEVSEALLARERLGSTALGRGVALPHARLLGDVPPTIIFARLSRAIDFEATDDAPVDLVFLLLWPETSSEGFLSALSEVCVSLRDPQTLRRLRMATAPEDVLAAIGQKPYPPATA